MHLKDGCWHSVANWVNTEREKRKISKTRISRWNHWQPAPIITSAFQSLFHYHKKISCSSSVLKRSPGFGDYWVFNPGERANIYKKYIWSSEWLSLNFSYVTEEIVQELRGYFAQSWSLLNPLYLHMVSWALTSRVMPECRDRNEPWASPKF